MFEKLFVRPTVLTRHQQAPYAQERATYLAHCAQEGYAHATLMETANALVSVARELGPGRGRSIMLAQIKTAAKRWLKKTGHAEQACTHPGRDRRGELYAPFVRTAKKWLQFLGRLAEPVAKPVPFSSVSDEFAAWMVEERGLSPATIRQQIGRAHV